MPRCKCALSRTPCLEVARLWQEARNAYALAVATGNADPYRQTRAAVWQHYGYDDPGGGNAYMDAIETEYRLCNAMANVQIEHWVKRGEEPYARHARIEMALRYQKGRNAR